MLRINIDVWHENRFWLLLNRGSGCLNDSLRRGTLTTRWISPHMEVLSELGYSLNRPAIDNSGGSFQSVGSEIPNTFLFWELELPVIARLFEDLHLEQCCCLL